MTRQASSKQLLRSEWEENRKKIERLHVVQKYSLREVMDEIERTCEFVATKRQYRRKIRQWGLDKNVKDNKIKAIIHREAVRFQQGKKSIFYVRNRQVDPKKIKRFARRNKIERFTRGTKDVARNKRHSKPFCHSTKPRKDLPGHVRYVTPPTDELLIRRTLAQDWQPDPERILEELRILALANIQNYRYAGELTASKRSGRQRIEELIQISKDLVQVGRPVTQDEEAFIQELEALAQNFETAAQQSIALVLEFNASTQVSGAFVQQLRALTQGVEVRRERHLSPSPSIEACEKDQTASLQVDTAYDGSMVSHSAEETWHATDPQWASSNIGGIAEVYQFDMQVSGLGSEEDLSDPPAAKREFTNPLSCTYP
ncbi:MAG: hypothetical protein LQ346_008814 [Caloplaca aetnensis]|nr:MAG: hypothetical protein LQ346_008814 [Caloplaca aetnensis]